MTFGHSHTHRISEGWSGWGTACSWRALGGRLAKKERRPKNSTFGDFLLLQSLENYFSNLRERSKYSLQYIFVALRKDDSTLRYGKTGNKKHATCFSTLLQNEFNINVARFTTHVQTCLSTNQVVNRFDVGGKTRDIAIQLVLQQCCKTSCTFFVARFTKAFDD